MATTKSRIEERYAALLAAAGIDHCHGAECFGPEPDIAVCLCPCDACQRAIALLVQAQREVDASAVAALDKLVTASHGHMARAPGARRRRVVMRLEVDTLARVDAVQARRWPGAKRAAVLRAFIVAGLALAEQMTPATPAPEGSAPCP